MHPKGFVGSIPTLPTKLNVMIEFINSDSDYFKLQLMKLNISNCNFISINNEVFTFTDFDFSFNGINFSFSHESDKLHTMITSYDGCININFKKDEESLYTAINCKLIAYLNGDPKLDMNEFQDLFYSHDSIDKKLMFEYGLIKNKPRDNANVNLLMSL